MKTVRAVSDIGWWIFVVSALFSLAANQSGGGPRRYAEVSTEDYGWTAYTPLQSGSGLPGDGFAAGNTFATITLVAMVIVVIAAHVEGFLSRDWVRAVMVVFATVSGGALVLIAMVGGIGSAQFTWPILYALVLLGVAVREIVTRRLPVAADRLMPRADLPSAAQRSEGVDEA